MYEISFDYDVAIIGGGAAGLAAALLLGRANIATVVLNDPDQIWPDTASHNFLTNDGRPKADIIRAGRADVARYPSVTFQETRVSEVEHSGTGYDVTLADGDVISAERLIIATGSPLALDQITIEGLASQFGKRIFTCPYCHAHEFGGQHFGMIASSPNDVEFARLLSHWADKVTVLLPKGIELPQADGFGDVHVHDGVLMRLEERPDGLSAVMVDGNQIDLDVVFVADLPVADNALAEQLGLSKATHPLTGKPIYKTDAVGRTELGSAFLIGDARTGFSTLAGAANEGQIAGFMVVNDVIEAARPRAAAPI